MSSIDALVRGCICMQNVKKCRKEFSRKLTFFKNVTFLLVFSGKLIFFNILMGLKFGIEPRLTFRLFRFQMQCLRKEENPPFEPS